MSNGNGNGRPSWDYNVGLVLAVLGGLILLFKFKIAQTVLSLWPAALIYLGWQMYRKADRPRRARVRVPLPPAPPEAPAPPEHEEEEELA